ncbi:hypothetical protein TEA_024054 [Camellia sinensis var. sinensis]|uniref:Alpha/beta hydrolase fold-3 domain-containing protein n=1 Tax=Camellia sinensis var. sinensis TaxID=542762 RepID=A0A4S4EBN0_CAMSN|nr:hypothetical protein TEA_024054 [Camellia sinensis var. sinensis]
MGSLATPPQVVEDCFGVLKLYSDGSIVRSPIIDYQIPINDDGSVVWKDSLFDKNHGLYLRLFKPTTTTNPSSSSSSSSSPNKKLPIVFYIHGGGFCLGSRSFANFHNTCHSLAFGLKAIVVSPDYRLAPEHRLPAAIEDVYGALKWVQDQAVCESPDEWVCGDEVEFDNVFILGDSSGGNVAHHLAVRIRPGSEELKPVQIRGYVLLSPFFGGAVLTKSEEERACEEFWNLDMYDRIQEQIRKRSLKFPAKAEKAMGIDSNPFLEIREVTANVIMPDFRSLSLKELREREDSDEEVLDDDSLEAIVMQRMCPKCKLSYKWLKGLLIDGKQYYRDVLRRPKLTNAYNKRPYPSGVRQQPLMLFWRLSLPEGATKDHPLSNPFGPSKSLSLKDTALDPILVVVGGGEILRDRVEDYARRLKEFGKKIDYVEFEGKEHGFFTTKSSSEEAKGVMQIFIDFMSKNSSLHNTSTIENSKLAFNNLGVTQLSSSMQ